MDFSFLMDEPTEFYLCAFDFLHGYCTTFAYIISKNLGYPIVMRRVKDPSPGEPDIIHAWCEKDGYYIDIRGKTKDYGKFWEEFEDFADRNPDEETEIFRFPDARSFYEFLEGNPISFSYQKLVAADLLFRKFSESYQLPRKLLNCDS